MPNYRRVFTEGGVYFLTVATQNRQAGLLTCHIDAFREAYAEAYAILPFKTLAICVLPDHFHMLMGLPEGDCNYSRRIGAIKRNFSARLAALRAPSPSQLSKREAGIWQRRFWEHLIRDDDDFSRHMDYIYYNPVKHGHVQRVRDWPHSSFHRDVAHGLYPLDWGENMTGIKEINE